ncbi:MAG: RsiV family protein [Megasphaera sp.]|jgi:hypothetical protein|nr:RsiV family protein [Megasphaera sp.]MCI1247717.1 RsiV family protein [Megasphaera sp.]
MKHKILMSLCSLALMGSMAFAAGPVTVGNSTPAVYTRDNGSELTMQSPVVSVPGNEAASQKIMQYFIDQEQKSKAFFEKNANNKMKVTEEKSYVVTLNDGQYLSIIDQGYIYFDRAAHPTSWKTGVTFDAATGDVLNWQDLVQPKDAKAFTLKRINEALLLSDYKLSTYFDGLTELPKNYYLDNKKNIHFIFGQYEVAPYSTGIVDINMHKQAK